MKKDIVIIGSKALKHHFSDFDRVPMDNDVICTRELYNTALKDGYDKGEIERVIKSDSGLSSIVKWKNISTPVEYLFSEGVKSFELILDNLCNESKVAPIEVLYSLKKAHINFPIKFNKHIKDLMFLREKLRQKKGVSLTQDLNSLDDLLDTYPALTHMHFKETEMRLGRLKTPKMDNSVEKFFGKSEKYVKSYYTHDDMHKAVAHTLQPAYLQILKDSSEVETDINKWMDLSIQEKIFCVLEEVYVIALERKIIPQLFERIGFEAIKWSPKEAFDWALMRVCTTLCDGFFRDFAVKAYDKIQSQYDENYINKFFKNIDKYGKIEE